MKYIAPHTNIVSVRTDDVMQGFIVTSYSIPSGEAKKGFVMDEDGEGNALSVERENATGWTSWEEQ